MSADEQEAVAHATALLASACQAEPDKAKRLELYRAGIANLEFAIKSLEQESVLRH